MKVAIDEVFHFDVITSNPTTGAAADADATPTFAVYEEATDTDIGVGGNLTKRTSLTGDYRGSFTASAANGFEAGKWYTVIASATVSTVAGKARAAHFQCVPAEASAGVPKVDTSHFGGTAGTFASGRPEVNATHLAGTAYGSADFSATMKASINTEADTAISDVGLTTTVTGRIDAAVSTRLATAGYTAPASAAVIADAVWDELVAGHLGAGSTGSSLNGAGSAGDPWTTTLPGAYGAGTAGYIVGTNIDALVSASGGTRLIIGGVTRSGSTYYVTYALLINGVIQTSGLSVLAVTFYDEDGTDLTFSGTPTAGGTGLIYASGTLGTTPSDNKPILVKVTVTKSAVAYSSILPAVSVA